jgi:hypothetical protein
MPATVVAAYCWCFRVWVWYSYTPHGRHLTVLPNCMMHPYQARADFRKWKQSEAGLASGAAL